MRFTVKAKLASAFGAVIALAMVIGGVSYVKLSDMVSTADGLVSAAGRMEKAEGLEKIILLQIRAEKNAILATSDSETDKFVAEVGKIRTDLSKVRDDIYAVATEGGRKLLDRFASVRSHFDAVQDETFKLAKLDKAKATERSTIEGRKAAGETMAAVGDYVVFIKKLMADRAEQAREDGSRAQMLLLGLVIASLLIAVASATWIALNISRGLAKAVGLAEAVALGEKMDFVPVVMGDERSHAILAAALQRGRPVSGHVYGREFVAAYAASGVTDTHEAIDRDIADDLLDAGVWIFLRGGPPTTPWHSLPQAIRTITELGASHKRTAVCTDDRDADDLMLFGLDWVVREAVKAGMSPEQAWSMGSLHGATRFAMDGEIGGLGGGRRADLVLLDDGLKPQSTWYGGELVVDKGKITPRLDQALSQRYQYPKAAYATVKLPPQVKLTPELPTKACTVNAIKTALPGITLIHDKVAIEPANDWETLFARHGLCFVAVIERHGKSAGNVAHGLLKDFGLKRGAVASSVGHDSHNIIVAGTNEADMQAAVAAIDRAVSASSPTAR